MAEIINIKNEAGEVQYPVTKPECVIDENGKSVLTLIQENGTKLRQEIDDLSERIDNLPKGDEFDKEGNYPLLHVGTADDLVGRGESVPAEFGFRASGGKSIKDGRAYIKRIKGNSVVWNQLRQDDSFVSATTNGVTLTIDGEAIVLNGTASDACDFHVQAKKRVEVIKYHKYLIVGGKSGYANYNLYDSAKLGSLGTNNTIVTALESGVVGTQRIYCASGQTFTNYKIYPLLIDLTQMFQSGNEPTTIEEFNARVATLGVDLNAYNEGQVIHCNTESIKSVGDNAWDEEWELGIYSSTSGKPVDAQCVRNKNKIRIMGNTQYYFHLYPSKNGANGGYAMFYDKDDVFLSYQPVGGGYVPYQIITTPANAYYMNFYVDGSYGTTYNHDIMISLVHSGWKQDTDAGYQPYWQDILPLPIIRKYFPDGMKLAGTAHDEIRFNKASGKWEYSKSKTGGGRIKGVDMGTLNWRTGTISNGEAKFVVLTFGIATEANKIGNILTNKYVTTTANENYNGTKGIALSNKGDLFVYDSAYTDVESFKAAMAGVILYYESNDWEWVELDMEDQNFRDYYQVADFGTEQSQSSVPSAPFSADIIYQFNAVDMIREHEIEITELQNVIATMQAQLASLTSNNK